MTSKDAKPSKSAKASKNVKRKAKTGKPQIGELADDQLDQVQAGSNNLKQIGLGMDSSMSSGSGDFLFWQRHF